MKFQRWVPEFAMRFVRRHFSRDRMRDFEPRPVADALEECNEIASIDLLPPTGPISWDLLAELIESHTSMSSQYVWLTATKLGLSWPDSLMFLQLQDLRGASADELQDKLALAPSADEKSAVLATLAQVLSYWAQHASASEAEMLNLERFVEDMLESQIDPTAMQVAARRTGNETLEQIGQSLGLSRERIRQIDRSTLQKIRQLPEFSYFKLLLHSHRSDIERQLLGSDGCARISNLRRNFNQSALVSLSIRCLYGSLSSYADANFVRFRNLYVRSGTDIDKLEAEFNVIEHAIETLSMPVRTEMALQELDVSIDALRWFSVTTNKFGLAGNYLHRGRLTSRVQRTIQLVRIASGCYGGEPASLHQLLSTFRSVFPSAPCSFRDFRHTTSEYSHQFVSLCDAGYSAICKYSALDDRALSLNAQEPLLDADECRSLDPWPLQTEMAGLVDEIGPAPLLTIRDEFVHRFGQKWSANSVFPTLKSTPYFTRMAPGIIGTLPMTSDPDKLTMRACLQSQTQVRFYVLAQLSESRITYPLWNPEVEFQWCAWGDENLPGRLYASLLSVADPDAWPISESEKRLWTERIESDGSFAISITPLRLSAAAPSIREIFALSLFASRYPTISWMDINRVLGNRIDSRKSLSYAAILSKVGVLRLPQDWLMPLPVNARESLRLMNEIVCGYGLDTSWREAPELLESNSDVKASWINPRELDELVTSMLSGKAEKPVVTQPDLFENR